ncbi:MAG TPA: sodium:calcium antiporter [Candidatus Altiarchaeales archaeon]|nr:sodium:calcium antiporter [Candidatus Altiarchaeales archaeon]
MTLYESTLVILGIIGLWFGSDLVVSSAKNIAERLRVSHLIVGLTIASIGTSLPEIFTNVMAGIDTLHGVDASGIAVGNIIGSDLGQITIILGIVGMFATLHITQRSLRRDGIMMFVAMSLMFLSAIDGYVSRFEGIMLVLIYILYLGVLLRQEKLIEKFTSDGGGRCNLVLEILKCFIGIAIVIYAADLVVNNGILLATEIGISSSLIGIFVGLGTSIPELSVSIKAIMRNAGYLSLGNLIGSNITDPLLSFGLGASIAGVTVSKDVIRFDFVYWMVTTVIVLLLLFNHMNLNRKESSILILMYLLFLYLRIIFFP